MVLYRVTFQDDSVHQVWAEGVLKLPNSGLWVFTAGDDFVVASFPHRTVRRIEVELDEDPLDEEPLEPRPVMRSG